MLAGNLMERADNGTLEQREHAFDSVGVNVAAHPFRSELDTGGGMKPAGSAPSAAGSAGQDRYVQIQCFAPGCAELSGEKFCRKHRSPGEQEPR